MSTTPSSLLSLSSGEFADLERIRCLRGKEGRGERQGKKVWLERGNRRVSSSTGTNPLGTGEFASSSLLFANSLVERESTELAFLMFTQIYN